MKNEISIPIVFSSDHNFIMPTGIAISSLIRNSTNEIYKIYIIVDGSVTEEDKDKIKDIVINSTSSIDFINTDTEYLDSNEERGITKATYYRLRIPWLFTQYDKIIYCDGDVIFSRGLGDLFAINIEDFYLAAVKDIYNKRSFISYLESIGLEWDKYFNAGVLLINNRKFREDSINEMLDNQCLIKYQFQDQDILNIVCKDKVLLISPKFNFNVNTYKTYFTNPQFIIKTYKKEPIDILRRIVIFHYCGSKPWKTYNDYCVGEWLEEYRRTNFYEPEFDYKLQTAIFHPQISFRFLKRLLLDYFQKLIR